MAKRQTAPPASQRGPKGARGKTGKTGDTGKAGESGPAGPPGVSPELLEKILEDVIDLRRIAEIQFDRLAQVQAQLDLLVANSKKKH